MVRLMRGEYFQRSKGYDLCLFFGESYYVMALNSIFPSTLAFKGTEIRRESCTIELGISFTLSNFNEL
ncbi:hypothetical protein LWI29_011655 [Acer saccharum]|uniref:Uncharacterized protein n=1 Tax=Acer saccharum TaxID=4024 RepID=A0AA39RPR7_ACESA|nr:hypothetical protein LWI29_011655 [Acer saccharum]